MNNRELKNRPKQERPFVGGVDLVDLDDRHQGMNWTGPVEGAQGIDRTYDAVFVSGEYTGDDDVHELPVLEVFTDSMNGDAEVGRRSTAYAQLPDGRLMPEKAMVEFKDGQETRTQELRRDFERMPDGSMRVKGDVLTVDGVVRKERTHADPSEYQGGEFIVDFSYDADGNWERTVSFWKSAGTDHWQRAVDSPDARRSNEEPRFEASLNGPGTMQGLQEGLPGFIAPPELPLYEQQPVLILEGANEPVFEEVAEAA